MSFESPLYLVALLAIPLVVALYIVHHRRRSRIAARYASPPLLPNVVDREPGRRRHVPPAILLIALTALLVGLARPKAELSVPRQDATIMIAIDTSRSMAADDVQPSRMEAAMAGIREFLAEAPDSYRVGVVSFASDARVVAPPTRDRELVDLALDELQTGEGTALGDAIAKAVEVGQAVDAASAANGEEPTPTTVLVVSDGKEDGGSITPQEASGQALERGVPVFTVGMGTPDGVVEVPLAGGYTARVQVPANPTTLRGVADETGGRVLLLSDARAAAGRVRRARVAAGPRGGMARGDGGIRGCRRDHAPPRRSAVGELVQEAAVRAAPVLVAFAGALAVLAAPSARAADECRGLQVCIPVAGPWVVIPRGDADGRFPQRSWRMKCPEGSIVGGVDARLTHRAVDMSFSGLLGSPVNPGVTTTEEVVFTGTYTGGARRPTGFRPFIGCIPTAGGGRIPTAVKPGSPTKLRVRTVSFTTSATATHSCLRGERLVSSMHAVALRSVREPKIAQLSGVRSELVSQGGRLSARATMSGAARALPAKLQIVAVCTKRARAP